MCSRTSQNSGSTATTASQAVARARLVALRGVGAALVEAERHLLIGGQARQAERLLEVRHRVGRAAELDRAERHHVEALELVAGRLERDAELADRVVVEAHLLVGDAEVEARLEVLRAELLLDAGLERGEDLLEALFLGAARSAGRGGGRSSKASESSAARSKSPASARRPTRRRTRRAERSPRPQLRRRSGAAADRLGLRAPRPRRRPERRSSRPSASPARAAARASLPWPWPSRRARPPGP